MIVQSTVKINPICRSALMYTSAKGEGNRPIFHERLSKCDIFLKDLLQSTVKINPICRSALMYTSAKGEGNRPIFHERLSKCDIFLKAHRTIIIYLAFLNMKKEIKTELNRCLWI